MDCGAPHGMEFSSTHALTIRRIEGGILGNGTDITPDMTPFEAGLAPFVNMDKGDFIGRTALLTKERHCCLFGVTCSTKTPAAGALIFDGGREVGRITAGITSPTLGLGVGYVHFNTRGDWVGRTLAMRLPDGSLHDAQIVQPPFFDPDKKIVRGLDRSIPERPAN